MYFTNDASQQLEQEFETIPAKSKELMLKFTTRKYKNKTSAEFAQQGFMRRVQLLERCIQNVFSLIPPDNTDPPSKNVRHDAEINIQTFVLSVFGCLDNLAWIWVIEKNVTERNGSLLRATWVGLRKENTIVRSAFPAEFQDYLQGLDMWLGYLEEFRHALAHRIPLYIPPYVVFTKDLHIYNQLEKDRSAALARLDHNEYDRLTVAQDDLKNFRPWMQHSFVEESKPMVFHAQLLADFNTINELGLKMLDELDRL